MSHVQFISTNSIFENDEGPGAAQLRWERCTWHLMFISYKRRNGTFYLSILQCKNGKGEKKKPCRKIKRDCTSKKTAVAGSGCVLPYSFRNNKHRLLTGRRRGGTAARRSALASQGSLKESGWRKREAPSENKHFSQDERCFFLAFSLFFFPCDHFDDNGSFSLPQRESCVPSGRVIPRLFHYVFTPPPLPQSKHFVRLFA